MKKYLYTIATALLLLTSITAQDISAQNMPCSGRKGGISHCEGDTFVCNDGSTSGSKRSCEAYMGKSSRTTSPLVSRDNQSSSICSCRNKTYCTGPRGGVYCLTDSGNKSYRRK